MSYLLNALSLASACMLIAMAIISPVKGTPYLTESHIHALAFGCDFSGAKTVRVLMLNSSLFGPIGRTLHVAATKTANGGLGFVFTAPPGPIYIDYSVDGQKCMSAGDGIVVLPGRDRHILISMNQGMFVRDWHARNFVAGTMPRVPVAISVVASDSPECPSNLMNSSVNSRESAAIVDGGAYYAGHIWGPHMFLKLTSTAFDVLYIRLPDATPVDSNDQYVRRDITESDIRALTTHRLNEEITCVQTPSGASTRFP